MGDANVRRPVATRFEDGVDFGLLVHKSPFMEDKKDPLIVSNYIFELLEVNPGIAGFLIQLHPEDVDAVLESVTGVPFARQWRPVVGVLRLCWLLPGLFDCFCCPRASAPPPPLRC